MFLINIALFGVVGIIIWSIQMAWTPIFAAGGINGAVIIGVIETLAQMMTLPICPNSIFYWRRGIA